MRFNDKEMAQFARKPGQLEGRLQYREPPGTFRDTGFRERFFKLIGNMLFYFRFTEVGAIDYKEPVGVIVLENYTVTAETDSDLSFAFGISFLDELDKRHIFTARTDSDVQLWVKTLRHASYQHWKGQLNTMQSKINSLLEAREQKKSMASMQRMAGGLNILDNSVRPRPNPFLMNRSQNQSQPNNDNDLIKF